MENILDKLFLPYLSGIGLMPVEKKHNFKRSGYCYRLTPTKGRGYYWIYPIDRWHAIAVCDLLFYRDISFWCEHPASLSLGYYESPLAHLICSRKALWGENLIAYIGNESIHRETFQKNVPIRGVSINLLPEFYQEILPTKYSEDFLALPAICTRLDGTATIPEVEQILKQIRASKPTDHFARMYYEGKVLEIISLVMQWGMNELVLHSASEIPDKDLEALAKIKLHVERHYAEQVSLEHLTRIACMSSSKLTSYFKRTYGLTITEYAQIIRMDRAKQMLLDSTKGVGEIAGAVGYKRHASFSEVFKRMTGLTPNEYRRRGSL
ncbi:AraC family transcriptional regulator [Paenibacillus motobuensis]|uniref:helix-turn-helix domain-containing protein n=1 Tax=Paenibacillus TaxID=44249 RepID=UPI00203D3EEF|nr:MULTISPECIES: AraC family transcriptional regulator [Paenibacillus]MCM3042159.1 AraC family transcriptional regulator [Paenibacillus lutimineralis]MCM3649263.1 AraC family transcriptional regulator [Paenibacillus motobuensis]